MAPRKAPFMPYPKSVTNGQQTIKDNQARQVYATGYARQKSHKYQTSSKETEK